MMEKTKKSGLEPGLTPQSEFQAEEGRHAMPELEKRLSHELALHSQIWSSSESLPGSHSYSENSTETFSLLFLEVQLVDLSRGSASL